MISQAIKAIASRSVVVFSLFFILSASAANAQTAAERLVFYIPFQFTAGDERLPAGEYTIRRVSQTGQAYFIKSRDGRSVAAVSVRSTLRAGKGAGGTQLTFNAYGGQYFLSQVLPGGGGAGAVFHRSQAEREVARGATDSRLVRVVAARK